MNLANNALGSIFSLKNNATVNWALDGICCFFPTTYKLQRRRVMFVINRVTNRDEGPYIEIIKQKLISKITCYTLLTSGMVFYFKCITRSNTRCKFHIFDN